MKSAKLSDLQKYDLVYLATPYSKYPGSIQNAFADAARLAGTLVCKGITIFSPIAHTHPIAIFSDIDPLNHDIWIPFDMSMMGKSDALLVAKMETWEISYGIGEEIKFFRSAGKPIFYLDPVSWELTHE